MLINKIKNKNGYTLFEIMIAIMIVSFGIISLSGLMISSMRYSKESTNRFVATQQLYEMADRMRANHKGVSAGYYDSITGLGATAACRTASCSVSDMAKFDAYEWNIKNSRVLPKGLGLVEKNGDGFLVTVQWSENENNNADPVTKDIKMRIIL